MKYGSVCSGIEAATVAWHPMGWKPSFYSEIDNFPRAVLQHHYPEVPLHGDFTTIQENDYDPIELLVGGTPCQSFSVAGLRKGLDDPRGNLMLGFGALAQRLGPTWLVWENVPGVLSANGGRDFGTFLGMLGLLGYGFAYRVLDAQYFGVAQRRRRVFVVGYLGDWRPAAAVLFERHSLSGHPAPSREAREEVAGTLTSSLGRRGGVPDGGDTQGQLQPVNRNIWVADVAGSLTARQATNAGQAIDDVDGNKIIAMAHGQAGAEISFNRGPTLTCNHEAPIVCHGTQDPCISDQAFALGRNSGQENALFVSLRGREGGATAELGGPIAGTLRAATGGGDKPHVMAVTGQIAHTLRGEGFDASEDGTGRGTPTISQGMAVRRLTPIECERLQGFPDDHTKIPYRNKTVDQCPDGPRYKALGNSMAVPLMHWIGKRIQQVEKTLAEHREQAA